jgi:hypothetical protein
MLRPFGFLALKDFYIIWLSNLLTITVLDKNRSAHKIDTVKSVLRGHLWDKEKVAL